MLGKSTYFFRALNCVQHTFRGVSLEKFASTVPSLVPAALRTHTCGELRENDIGKSVTLCGWLFATRVSSSFLLLKDSYGTTQVLVDKSVCEHYQSLQI